MLNDFLKKSPRPYYLKRIAGIVLTLIGIAGFILTFPFAVLGGVLGLLKGIIDGKNPLTSAVKGIKISSLGSVNAILLGIELARATTNPLESVEQQIPLVKSKSAKLNAEDHTPLTHSKEHADPTPTIKPSTVADTFFPRPVQKAEAEMVQPPASHHFNNPEKMRTFLTKVNQFIAQDEARIAIKEEDDDDLSQVKELYIEKLIAIIKDPTASKNDFWERLEQMANKDIKSFVSKLSARKEKGKFSSTELDYLWRQFNGFEFELSKREKKGVKFAVMLKALSEEQLNASFDSPDFLNILNKDSFADTAANTFTRKQLELFAANIERHEILNSLIKKLKPGPYLLGKLVSIIPYATWKMRTSLIDQISHLSHPASFKIELTKLVDHYLHLNLQAHKKQLETSQLNRIQSAPLPTKKWAPVHAATKPVYTKSAIKRKDWSDAAFDAFMNDLNATTFILNEKRIIDDLDSLPDHRIKMLVERASAAEFKNLLQHIWLLDSKTINNKSSIECRENRLKIILENITESQLTNSLETSKFWEIFSNTQEPFCEMAAQVLSPKQFATIISHAPLERHSDFAIIIAQIKQDSPAEKERLQKIIEAIIPHTTPWFALVLEQQIRNLLIHDKHLFERLHADFKMALTQSLASSDINFKYKTDRSLNKRAISYLLIESQEDTYSAPFRL